jgi:hypothetical protein
MQPAPNMVKKEAGESAMGRACVKTWMVRSVEQIDLLRV